MSFAEFFMSSMSAIGLGTYSGRFIFGSVLGFAAQMALKPSISYTKDGRMKPFIFGAKDKQNATYVPWWMLTLLPGLGAVLFI